MHCSRWRIKSTAVGGGLRALSPGAQGSKMSRAGPKGLKVVSN